MNNIRHDGIFIGIVLVTLWGAAPSFCQFKPYLMQKLKKDGTVHNMVVAQPNHVISLANDEKLATVKTGDSIQVLQNATLSLPHVVSKRTFTLPEKYYLKVGGSGDLVTLNTVFVSDGPMKYNPQLGVFQGTLYVIIQDPSQTQTRTLSQSISFTIVSEADQVNPKQAEIDHSNLPATEIAIASSHPADTVSITFLTSLNPQGYKTALHVEPTLSISTADTVIQAYGIETTDLVVSMKPVVSNQQPAITASVSQGSLEPENIKLDRGQGSTRLRSGSLGKARVTLTSSEYSTNDVSIIYVFPWRFLVFVLIGGIVGGLIRLSNKKGPPAKLLIVGVFWGLVVAVAWAGVGLNLLKLPLPGYTNEAVVFVLGALAAIVGPEGRFGGKAS